MHSVNLLFFRGKIKRCLKQTMAIFLIIALLGPVFSAGLSVELFSVSVHGADQDEFLSEHVIKTISPAHVKFNLFDYWITSRDATSERKNISPQGGINKGHAFVFGGTVGWGPWNVWTGNESHYDAQPTNDNIRYGIYPGVVDNQLQDGYPVLTISTDHGGID